MEFKLRMLFFRLLQLANKHRDPRYGDPCSGLLEQMVLYSDYFFAQMLDAARDTSHEYRLNEAGLKMLWVYTGRHMYITIAGDQKDLYPAWVEAAEVELHRQGFFPINEQR